MPVNAPVEYFKAEEKFLSARSRDEKIKYLEEMIRLLPKHKSSENVLRNLRKKLAKLRSQQEKKAVSKPKFVIKKEGAGQVCLMGLTNSGKSTLLKQLTNVDVEIANYAYTTKEPVVGMMRYEDVQIQLIEIPSTFTNDVMSVVRNCDGIVFVLDGEKNLDEQKQRLLEIMQNSKIKINEKPKDIKIEKKTLGGIEIRGGYRIRGSIDDVKQILLASGYSNCLVIVNENVDIEDIMDAMDRSLVYKNAVYLVTKRKDIDFERIKEEIWSMLSLIRIYTKSPGKSPEKNPITLPVGSCVRDAASMIHKDFLSRFKFARVWGKSVKFNSQKVGLDHVLADKDILEIHT